jgi:hypothetical protein
MRFAICLAVLCACTTVDLASRPAWPAVPLCLVVNTTPESWKSEHVAIAAAEWNERLGANLVHVAPECVINDEWVVFSFVYELPNDCRSHYACTYLRSSIQGRPTFREVVLSEDAPFSSIGHEIGHLFGCRHADLDPPCRGGAPS